MDDMYNLSSTLLPHACYCYSSRLHSFSKYFWRICTIKSIKCRVRPVHQHASDFHGNFISTSPRSKEKSNFLTSTISIDVSNGRHLRQITIILSTSFTLYTSGPKITVALPFVNKFMQSCRTNYTNISRLLKNAVKADFLLLPEFLSVS